MENGKHQLSQSKHVVLVIVIIFGVYLMNYLIIRMIVFIRSKEDGNDFPQHYSFLQNQIYETKKYFQDQLLDKKLGRSCCTVVQHTSHHLEVVGLSLALIFSYFICYFQLQVDCP